MSLEINTTTEKKKKGNKSQSKIISLLHTKNKSLFESNSRRSHFKDISLDPLSNSAVSFALHFWSSIRANPLTYLPNSSLGDLWRPSSTQFTCCRNRPTWASSQCLMSCTGEDSTSHLKDKLKVTFPITTPSNHSESILLQAVAPGRRPWLPSLPPGGQTRCILGFWGHAAHPW